MKLLMYPRLASGAPLPFASHYSQGTATGGAAFVYDREEIKISEIYKEDKRDPLLDPWKVIR